MCMAKFVPDGRFCVSCRSFGLQTSALLCVFEGINTLVPGFPKWQNAVYNTVLVGEFLTLHSIKENTESSHGGSENEYSATIKISYEHTAKIRRRLNELTSKH